MERALDHPETKPMACLVLCRKINGSHFWFLGDRFSPQQVSQAHIAGFNWWSRALSLDEMNRLTCRGTKGDILTQSEMSAMGAPGLYEKTFCCHSKVSCLCW